MEKGILASLQMLKYLHFNGTLVTHPLFVSVRCLQPEGLFKDPTDNTRYIHCQKGEPHTMVCPDEMTWDDSKKSCFGAGTCKTKRQPKLVRNCLTSRIMPNRYTLQVSLNIMTTLKYSINWTYRRT